MLKMAELLPPREKTGNHLLDFLLCFTLPPSLNFLSGE
jgi:hypothetical protein